MFSQLCPIFALVCSTFYFPELQIRLTLLGITFFMNTFTFCFLLSSLKLLAGRISGGLENTWSTTCIFNPLFPIFLTVCFVFYFWHTILVLNDIGNTFLENVFLVLDQVPTAAYLMAQHKSYEHHMTLCRKLAETKELVPL